jgi:hypothetical protein
LSIGKSGNEVLLLDNIFLAMVIIKMGGGLGNQMFQYALGKTYQVRRVSVMLDLEAYNTLADVESLRRFELSIFNITIPVMSTFFKNLFYSRNLLWRLFRRTCFFWIKIVNESRMDYNSLYLNQSGAVLKGFFQSEKYFAQIENVIRKDFVFQAQASARNNGYIKQIIASNSISLHIRRTDYISDEIASKLQGALPPDYYYKAIALVARTFTNPVFFVFSDDLVWTKEFLKGFASEIIFVSGNTGSDSWQDLLLMSLCKHNIIANSTFSWWGAWLNVNSDKMVIAPSTWYKDAVANSYSKDLVPASWVRL